MQIRKMRKRFSDQLFLVRGTDNFATGHFEIELDIKNSSQSSIQVCQLHALRQKIHCNDRTTRIPY